MNYQRIYNSLMDRARNRLLECYVERHHVVPRCMGGINDNSNIVALLPEEHYVAHQLLVKMYPDNNKLVYAAHMMTTGGSKVPRHNKEYGWLRRRFVDTMRQNHPLSTVQARSKLSQYAQHRTRNHQNKLNTAQNGHQVSNETKAKLRTINLGKRMNQASKRKISEWNTANSPLRGKIVNDITKQKMSLSAKQRTDRHQWSAETRDKMSTAKRRWWANRKLNQVGVRNG